MKKFLLLILLIGTFSSCHDSVPEWIPDTALEPSARKYNRKKNLPYMPDTLRILGIGNSFTNNGMEYIPKLLRNAGISNIILGKACYGGCTLQQHEFFLRKDSKAYEFQVSNPPKNTWQTISENITLRQAIQYNDWDIIVLQQASSLSGLYTKYQPYLNRLIENILSEKTNPNMVLAWQMTWAYSSNSSHSGFANYNYNQDVMYDSILHAVCLMKEETQIKYIIPSGICIQKLRETSLNNPPSDITADGFHIDNGMGKYALACTWFETLITPVFNLTIDKDITTINENNVMPVNDENRKLIHSIVKEACNYDNKEIE